MTDLRTDLPLADYQYPTKPVDGPRLAIVGEAPGAEEARQGTPFVGRSGKLLDESLAAVGIDAELVNNDAAAHMKAVYTDHAFDLAVGPPVFRGDPAISTTILVQSGVPDGVPFSNQGGYRNAEIDALIEKASETLDAARRTELYKEFQRKVVADLPLINVADWSFISVASEKVKNVADNPRWAVSNWADTWLEE